MLDKLSYKLSDSHCHLDMFDDYSSVIKRAKDAGVEYLQTISTSISDVDKIIKIAEEHENVFASIGVHPDHVSRRSDIAAVEELEKLTKHEKVIGIGETGLDYFREGHNKEFQKESLVNHIEVSIKTNLPIIIHTRDASEDTHDILSNHTPELKGLIHCFTADVSFARKILDIGFYISISGIVTFKNAVALQEAVKFIPLDRLLIETDSPFLAPVPMRGKQNEPSFVRYVAQKIADIKHITFQEVASSTTQNFLSLFNKINIRN